MRARLLAFLCLVFLSGSAVFAQEPAAEPPPREPEVQRVLDDWIRASESRGAFFAEVRRLAYDDAAAAVKVSDSRVWAGDPWLWRYDSVPPAGVTVGDKVQREKIEYTVSAAVPRNVLMGPDSIVMIDLTAKTYQQIDIPRELLHQPDRPPVLQAVECDCGPPNAIQSWFRWPVDFTDVEWQKLVAFPQHYREELEFCRVELGPRHNTNHNDVLFEHLIFTPRTEQLCRSVCSFEVLFDAKTHLVRAVKAVHPGGNSRSVYDVRRQRPLSALERSQALRGATFETLTKAGYTRSHHYESASSLLE